MLPGWEKLNRTIKNLKKTKSGRSNLNMQATGTSDSDPPEPSQSTIASTEAKDFLAFRTIITMLSCIQSSNTRLATNSGLGPLGTGEHRTELRVLDALSAVLVRQHEVTAVVAKPYNGFELQVFVSVVYPDNTEPFFQSGAESGGQGILSRICNFTFAINSRNSKINGRTDSLINLTPLPLIGDHQEQAPEDLVTAAKGNATAVLDTFLKNHW